MANEKEEELPRSLSEWTGSEVDYWEARCTRLEQQLAQAQKHAAHWEEEFRVCRELLLKQEADARSLQTENTAMRALLEQVVSFNPEWVIDGNPCLFCDANAPGGDVIHSQECLIVQIRAQLAK